MQRVGVRRITFGRSERDGKIEFYFDNGEGKPEEGLAFSISALADDNDLSYIIKHIEEQIYYNTPYGTPVAILSNFAVTLDEAKEIHRILSDFVSDAVSL